VDTLKWRKNSHSTNQGGACVEIAQGVACVHARDSKHPQGPVLQFGPAEWRAFVTNVKSDTL
jgi:Domain of unknown function (DUF397)